MLNLLFCALGLECLGLSTTSLCLVGDLPFFDDLAFLLMDGLHKDTLVLEDITLAFHVKGVVQILVDLLGIAVLLQQRRSTRRRRIQMIDDGIRASLRPT